MSGEAYERRRDGSIGYTGPDMAPIDPVAAQKLWDDLAREQGAHLRKKFEIGEHAKPKKKEEPNRWDLGASLKRIPGDLKTMGAGLLGDVLNVTEGIGSLAGTPKPHGGYLSDKLPSLTGMALDAAQQLKPMQWDYDKGGMTSPLVRSAKGIYNNPEGGGGWDSAAIALGLRKPLTKAAAHADRALYDIIRTRPGVAKKLRDARRVDHIVTPPDGVGGTVREQAEGSYVRRKSKDHPPRTDQEVIKEQIFPEYAPDELVKNLGWYRSPATRTADRTPGLGSPTLESASRYYDQLLEDLRKRRKKETGDSKLTDEDYTELANKAFDPFYDSMRYSKKIPPVVVSSGLKPPPASQMPLDPSKRASFSQHTKMTPEQRAVWRHEMHHARTNKDGTFRRSGYHPNTWPKTFWEEMMANIVGSKRPIKGTLETLDLFSNSSYPKNKIGKAVMDPLSGAVHLAGGARRALDDPKGHAVAGAVDVRDWVVDKWYDYKRKKQMDEMLALAREQLELKKAVLTPEQTVIQDLEKFLKNPPPPHKDIDMLP